MALYKSLYFLIGNAMKDLFNQIHPLRVISPVSVADTTAQVGQIIDRWDALA